MKYILTLILVGLFFSCTNETSNHHYFEGNAFGTNYHIQLYANEANGLQKGIDSVINAVNQSLSTYIPESDISKINRGDATVVVDDLFREVFNLSSRIHRETDGYFDPTIGVLRNAYGFGDVKSLQNIDDKTLDSLMQYVGFNKVALKEDGTVRKEYSQIYFDFNAIAKGSGIDQIGRYFDSKGVSDYLIELGGEILTKGKNIDKNKLWTVGIETPDSELENRSFEAAVMLKDVGMASSGNYRKFRVDSLTGKKYVHTLNPLTGSAEMSDVTSATVIASSCGEADAYATALMALGFEKSKELLNRLSEVDAYITYTDSLNQQSVYITEGFKRRMPK